MADPLQLLDRLEAAKRDWKGWCTIESEPAVFTQLVTDFGVKNCQVEEVYSLDEESLASLEPVHGLIFLFRWKQDRDVQADFACPENVWFANQVIDNACASLAILNIVMNCADVDIGENLRSFRNFTKDFTPPLRGIAMAEFDAIHRVHNTFARTTDMMDSDATLKTSASKKRKVEEADSDDEDGEEDVFHFIAYVPVDGCLWELDGLKKGPNKIGECTKENWTRLAAPRIQERITKYSQEEIRFNLLAVIQNPLHTHLQKQARNKALLEKTERQISLEESLEQKSHVSDITSEAPMEPDSVPGELEEDADNLRARMKSLEETRSRLKNEINDTEARIVDEETKATQYQEYAERRRHDYTPFIRKMIEKLNENGILQAQLE
ncbi:hypothetical protein SAICODRAFT_9098 [Saitoella complicata NRRL Y-17804]|nr:uncharacterized protein SAICODRAFT_9098 [Saitoella complicata NRRL Y-17804]ODQ51448.1 hypothetical protein SAICODRAFT_9098 [Saitoella complicata NRRL Y-17804]